MFERWKRKKERTRKARKPEGSYTWWDGFWDVLFWVPELLILPFRLVFFVVRVIGRVFRDVFDFTP
ncbi:hypothetical protein [Thalassobacillus hwangdonensis]|uniref:Uncharacterized protein n=1 Tax=Thalassobacillus hwangdonensis TaxID=546108 RepID=A0ABW3L4U7_9BACI